MPYKSLKQERWANSPAGVKAMGKSTVNEWNQASKGMKLPLRSKKKVSIRKPAPKRRMDVVAPAALK